MFQTRVSVGEDCWSRAGIDWKDCRETATSTHVIKCSRGMLDWVLERCGSNRCFTSDLLLSRGASLTARLDQWSVARKRLADL
jgi:hypothetical protein